MKSNVIT